MLWRIAGFAALGGFLFGYDLGVMGGALLGISDEFGTSDWADGMIVGAAKLGACFGAFLGGALMLHYGRRLAITIDSLLFMLGPIIMATSRGATGLVVGRLLVGLGIGVSAVVVPAYLGEVAPPQARGTIVELYEVLLCCGMLCALLVDWMLSSLPGAWRWMVAAPFLPALFMSAALFVLPESPRWLVVNSRLDEALAVIKRILASTTLPDGSKASAAEAEQELLHLWSGVEKDRAAQLERAALRRRCSVDTPYAASHLTPKCGGQRKSEVHSLSSIESAARQGRGLPPLSGQRRTPRPGPTPDRTPSRLPLLRISDGSGAKQGLGRSPALGNIPQLGHMEGGGAAAADSDGSDGRRDEAEMELQPLVTSSGAVRRSSSSQSLRSRSSSRTGDTLPLQLLAVDLSDDSMRASASGPSLREMHAMDSPATPPLDRETDVPFGRPSLPPGIVTSHEVTPTSQSRPSPETVLSSGGDGGSREGADTGDGGSRGSGGDASIALLQGPQPPRQRRKQRWQDYGEGSSSPEEPLTPEFRPPPPQHDGNQQLLTDTSNSGASSAQHRVPGRDSAGAGAVLDVQRSLSLTVRTERGSPSGTAFPGSSPVVWYDQEGTPQFHQSLSVVPAGLTPIRTRSDDFEAELAADGRARDALQQRDRQAQAQRSRKAPPQRTTAAGGASGGGVQGVVAGMAPADARSPSFAATMSNMLVDITCVAWGDESGAFWVAIWLAFFNQACASTAIINYAPQLLDQAGGMRQSDSIFFSSFVSASKVAGVVGAMLLIDRVGRRPLLLAGSAVTASAMTVLAMSDAVHSAALVLAAMCAFIIAFSMSWAGVFWVLMSEIFSMPVKSPAVAAATAALFLAGAVTDFVFLALHRMFGAGTFLLFAAVSAAGGVFVHRNLPETRGRNLEEVQALMKSMHHQSTSRPEHSDHLHRQLTPGLTPGLRLPAHIP
mmetsp:Transcript_16261/g.48710  ORF Transcript_16261/g.48710 Transcript_16261/m.48710 type:complete len:947 (-) Transcript_16261:1340-4180(-)